MFINFDPVRSWLAPFYGYIIAGSVALNLVLGVGFYVQGQRMHSAKVELKAEKAAHKQDKQLYEQTQKEAERMALDQKHSLERKYDEFVQKADADAADLRRKFAAALLRLKSESASRKSVSVPPEAAASPEGVAGTGPDPFVPTRLSDLQICADNTVKALIAHDWAKKVAEAQAGP